MALGGGTFTSQNKVLPGAYINFVSAARADAVLSDRGIVTMGMELSWGPNDVFEVSKEDLEKNPMKLFGYPYDADELSMIRDIFCNAKKLYIYRLNGGGEKASNEYATARYTGTRGNDIRTVIQVNLDTPDKFDVKTYLGNSLKDTQTVGNADELEDNDYVTFKHNAELSATAGSGMSGGTNSEVTGENHAEYLNKIESYRFHAIGAMTEDEATNRLYAAFTKRMREEVGVKFQCVLYHTAADHEGVINVKNGKELVPWVLGAEGGCAVNKSCTNKKYDGEAAVQTEYTQKELESAVLAGEFVLHREGDDIRVLTDINSLITLTPEKGEDFQSNQSIRVMDQIGNDIAAMFNTQYIGVIANNNAGRNAFWIHIVKYLEKLRDIGAVENFSKNDIVVEAGENKKSVAVVFAITVANMMEKLYMTVVVS